MESLRGGATGGVSCWCCARAGDVTTASMTATRTAVVTIAFIGSALSHCSPRMAGPPPRGSCGSPAFLLLASGGGGPAPRILRLALHVGVASAAESERSRRVSRLQRAAKCQSHEARVVLLVPGHEGARAAELQAIGALSRAAVARDERAVEVEHPLPDEVVQVVDPPGVRRPPPHCGQIRQRGRCVPREDPLAKAGLRGAVGALLAGARGELPFRFGR